VKLTPADLRTVPFLRELSDEQLGRLQRQLSARVLPAGETLFRAHTVPTRFILLGRGEVHLLEDGEVKHRVRAVAAIGELAALTGIPRASTAVAATEVEVLWVEVLELLSFFEKNGDIAFPFYSGVLRIVAEKVVRDRRRLEDLRAKVSDNNRRSTYRVAPTSALPAVMRMADGAMLPVLDFSEGHVKIVGTADWFAAGSRFEATLALPTAQVPIRGVVERAAGDGAVVKLQAMTDADAAIIEDYVQRLRLLDYVA